MKVIENEVNAVIDNLIYGAKSKYEGYGTMNKPDTFIDEDGDLAASPAAWELIGKKNGYFFLFPEYQKIKGAEFLVCYYLKISEYGGYPFTPTADAGHRVYVFSFIRNKKTGALTQGGYIPQLSEIESRITLEKWSKYMDEIAGERYEP